MIGYDTPIFSLVAPSPMMICPVEAWEAGVISTPMFSRVGPTLKVTTASGEATLIATLSFDSLLAPDVVDEDEDDEDDEDETAELLAELERIKKERAEEQQRKLLDEKEAALEGNREEILNGNPLLNAGGSDFATKKRWDDDVVFRNQTRNEPKRQKRFINDTIRSDFHRRFLNKYIK
mmetsp:Transcript_2060/g.4719  ORF Transcript_2060/g.4719 Transcript_2060/m.4719 type:complete len:178 (-) Transcript_2060:238-771(-)